VKQSGLAPIFIVLLLAILAVGVGTFVYQQKATKPVACNQEAKLCPDGTSVGRIGPHCDFASCPAPKESTSSADMTNWKTYTNPRFKVSFKYPPDLLIVVEKKSNDTYDIFFTRSEAEKQTVEDCLKQLECYSYPFAIRFKVITKPSNKTLKDVIWDDSRMDIRNFSSLNIDNLPSLQEQLAGVGGLIIYSTYIDRGQTVFFVQVDTLKDLEKNVTQILSTFKFLP